MLFVDRDFLEVQSQSNCMGERLMKIFKEKMGRDEILSAIKNILLVLLGAIIISFGTAVFLIPFDLVAGGMSGIAIVLDKIIPIDWLSVDVLITIETWSLFTLGAVVLGRKFAAKTLLSTIVYPPFVNLFMKLASPEVLNGYFYLPGYEYADVALLVAAVSGGALVGIGCALSFLGGGSTGGTDVIAFTISKILPKVKSSHAVFMVDATIVVLGVFVIGNMIVSLLGILAVFISTTVIDKIFLGGSRAFVCEIVSDSYAEINRQIIEKMDRTTTIIDVVGGYSGEDKKMLKVSFTMREYASLLSIVGKCDKGAFVTVHRAHEINGEGWTF